MRTTEVTLAFGISTLLILLIITIAVRYHQTWENSRLRNGLLWTHIEIRATIARRTRIGNTLRVTMTGSTRLTGTTNTALLNLSFHRTNPYAVRLTASDGPHTHIHTLSRDLLTDALRTGHAGQGLVRAWLITPTTLGVTIDPQPPGTGVSTYRLPAPAVQTALNRFARAIPLGAETLDIDTALTQLLNETPRP